MLPAYAYLSHSSSDFPAASDAQGQILSLPMFPELSASQIEHVANIIKAFYSKK
jgi:dTDP-4-amino-4,6-dideoxygalactose transaminase